ncbi:MAG: ATP-binding protein [bacterium]|nr:ATP-binding protein [bacterium]
MLDSLVTSSALVYFSILDETQTPIIFSSLYNNFLPLQGEGTHIINTPKGRIFQIEKKIYGKNFVSGFTMSSLKKIQSQNNLFLIFIIIVFALLEITLLFNYIKFDKFKIRKEREVNLLKEIGALSTGFAHEFRNSLHTLSLLGNFLNEEEKNILYKEIDRMKLVMDSLKLMGKAEIEKKEVKVYELIDESLSLLQGVISSEIKVEKNINEKLVLYGNRLLLVTVFSNLLKNSIEADAKNISILAIENKNNLFIDFIDDGKGIDSKISDKIFEPFFSQKPQSGLGLFLARAIIEAHGGKIEFCKGKKTNFKIIFKKNE